MFIKRNIYLLWIIIATLLVLSTNIVQGMTNWRIQIIDDVDDGILAGSYVSLAMINGQPAVSYYQYTNRDLMYARYDGAMWQHEVVDSVDDVGAGTSLIEYQGQPAIAYRDETNNDLKYAHYNGTSWDITVVDIPTEFLDPTDVGRYPSMQLINNRPAISYYGGNDLRYAYLSPTGWEYGDVTTDNTNDTGLYTSLVEFNAEPAISFYDIGFTGEPGKLMFARRSNGSWIVSVVDDSASVGEYTSIAIVDGQPAISYFDLTNNALKYARRDAGGGLWQIETVDNNGIVGRYSSLAVVDGQPTISYYSDTNQDLKIAQYDGTQWQIQTVDAQGLVGKFSSLMELNGQPAIAYTEYANSSFPARPKFANGNTAPSTMDNFYVVDLNKQLIIPPVDGILSNDNDGENDALTVSLVDNASNGTLGLNLDGSFTYTPNTDFIGEDTFTYTASDGLLTSAVTTVTITIVDPLDTAIRETWIVDTNGDYRQSSLAEIRGLPAIAYHDSENGVIKYARYDGISWHSETIESSAGAIIGGCVALVEVNNNPAIAYYALNSSIRYAYQENETWLYEDIDTANVGSQCYGLSMVVDQGEPVVAYSVLRSDGQPLNGELMYARRTGNNWGTESVTSATETGRDVTMIINDQVPTLVYMEGTQLVQAVRPDANWVFTTIDSNTSNNSNRTDIGQILRVGNALTVPHHNFLPTTAGIPDGELLYNIRYDGVWQTETLVDDPGRDGQYLSSALVDERVAISYINVTDSSGQSANLYYTWDNGDEWQFTILDDSGSARHTDLEFINRRAVIAYRADDQLKVISLGNASWPTDGVPLADRDVNNDGVITPVDAIATINRLGNTDAQYDVNNDGIIDTADVNLITDVLGNTVP